MPVLTLDYLSKGDPQIVEWWRAAIALWDDLLAGYEPWEDEDQSQLARIFSDSQLAFEQRCGFREPGKEIMAWSFFARLYQVGAGLSANDALARAGLAAFQRSRCSGEIKMRAKKAAELFGLE
ncbi:MAG: hypothetical protein HUU35_14975 [Armatimonadetes bacterium]|nr:hypothetical protein [Armatimonadota bacterium]